MHSVLFFKEVTSLLSRATIFIEMVLERGHLSSLRQSSPGLKQYSSGWSEPWFFYWMHPLSSWKSQLSRVQGQTVYIPLNWAFHSSGDGKHLDFGKQRGNRELSRLIDIAESLRKDMLFFLPLGPCALFKNGGVPADLADCPVESSCGMDQAFVDREGKINRFYSFYDPRIFQAFQNYVASLAQYFSDNGMIVSVMGCNSGGVSWERERGFYTSHGEDSSRSFQKGLARFVKKNDLGGERSSQVADFYTRMTQELYLSSARDLLGDYWMGSVELCFLGGGPKDLLRRSLSPHSVPVLYTRDILFALSRHKVPSSALLGQDCSKEIGFLKFFPEAQAFNSLLLKESAGDLGSSYHPLRILELYGKDSSLCGEINWHQRGLHAYLEENYRGLYGVRESFAEIDEEDKGFGGEGDEDSAEQLHIMFGSEITGSELTRVLQSFLDGFCFIIDICEMDEDLKRQLECFALENSLKTEIVRYEKMEIKLLQLGQSRMVLFSGELLGEMSENITGFFWDKIFSIFELSRQRLVLDDGMALIWQKRYPLRGELDFEHIRRAVFYNFTDKKKQVIVEPHKDFRLLKYQDQYEATGKRVGDSIYLVFEAGGYMMLDFGFIA